MLFNSDRSSRNINVCLYIHISLCQVCLDLSFLISLTRLSLLEHISLVKHAQLREHCTTDQHGWIGDLRSQCWDSGMLQSPVAKLVAHVWLALTPFRKVLELKVRGALDSSCHQLSNGYWNFVISTKNDGDNWV